MRIFNRSFLLTILSIFLLQNLSAKEGMWIPTLLAAIEDDMQSYGLELTAADIYSVNQSSLKDAIIQFGGGCTGEVISSQGLILTNHHCGFRQIQRHSSLERNILKDGFWAKDFSEELANPGLTAMFVVSIEDVTERMMKDVDAAATLASQRTRMAQNEQEILAEIRPKGKGYNAFIRPFNYGNSYFMIVTKTYDDVRLVGAPPSSIGKFGGDTDNWVWPRHTGDFSLFRIYAGPDNEPAKFDAANRPYEPETHLAVSVDGVKEGDFTMVFGFPGRTEQFLTTAAVEYIINEANPMRIAMRESSLGIIDAAMRSDEALHIKYADKQSKIANAYKKWIGQNIGLIELDAIGQKRSKEGAYRALAGVKRKPELVENIDRIAALNAEIRDYRMARDVVIEYFYYGPEIFSYAKNFEDLVLRYKQLEEANELESTLEGLRAGTRAFFKDYDKLTDETIYEKLTGLYFEHMPDALQPDGMKEFRLKYKNNPAVMRTSLYGRTVFADSTSILKLLDSPSAKSFAKLEKDPAFKLAQAIYDGYINDVRPEYERIQGEIDKAMKLYVSGLQELFPLETYWYDANSTLRLTYGKVEGSSPYDGMRYDYYTTQRGLIQKNATGNADYELQDDLLDLYKGKVFGAYADDSGDLRICFTGSNHTTGGNSGSPALNGRGELVGLNFDRSWESTMSDVLYDADRCRNIMVDARYILWVIDVYANAGHLINEMTLVSQHKDLSQFPVRKN